MQIKIIGAAAAVALLISGAVMAQQPMQQQTAPTPPAPSAPAAGPAMAPAPAAQAPVQATPVPDASKENKMAEAAPPKPHLSGCQLAIKASERALDKSQASPETIASAWQHISTAKQEKGSACKSEAKAAQEML